MMKKAIFGMVLGLLLGCNTSKKSNVISYSTDRISEAVPFAKGVISTAENSEFQIVFSPDGRKAYFSRRAPEEKQKIYETDFKHGRWSEPKVCAFSTDRDETPSITPNGALFFFGSERPMPDNPNKGNFDMNIWMMHKTTSGWSTPTPLPYPINDVQVAGEEWPSSNNNLLTPLSNERFYYTTMVRGTKAIKLFETEYKNGKFSNPVEIKGFFDDEKYWVYAPAVSPDGQYLVFNSFDAPGGLGGEDIYIAKRTQTGWTKAKSMGTKVNSVDEESSAQFSRDGRYFFFSKAKNLGNDTFGEWDICYIETKYLQLDKLFE